jgi:hypothetical protein
MRASEFEYRHQTLIHQIIIAAAFLTYLLDRDDIVWRFTHDRGLERCLFGIATILIGLSAAMRTAFFAYCKENATRALTKKSGCRSEAQYAGSILYAIGLGSLAPLSGFVILVAGEAIRLLRLALGEYFNHPDLGLEQSSEASFLKQTTRSWSEAVRREVAGWGIFVTMIVFTVTLKDRLAEVMAGTSFW